MKQIILLLSIFLVVILLGLFFFFDYSSTQRPIADLPTPASKAKQKKFTYQYTSEDLANIDILNKLPIPETPKGYTRLPILLYHHISDKEQGSYYVSPDIFRQQMAWLSDNNYKIISLSDAVDYIQMGQTCEKCVVITFDDGNLDQFTNAVPILEEYGYPATFFVVPQWTKKSDYMTEAQVKLLDQKGFHVGSHAWSHRDMQAASSDERNSELIESKKYLEKLLNKKVDFFAYPGGSLNSEAVQAVGRLGYNYALSVNKTIDHKPDNFLTLGRMHIDNDLPYFIARIEGRYKK